MLQRGLRVVEPRRSADLLDLVALGTVADLVPLDRNNRILVQQGLRRIRARPLRVPASARCSKSPARASSASRRPTWASRSGPRLNAAGRLDDMTVGIQCLLADDIDTARVLAGQLSATQPGAPRTREPHAAGGAC